MEIVISIFATNSEQIFEDYEYLLFSRAYIESVVNGSSSLITK